MIDEKSLGNVTEFTVWFVTTIDGKKQQRIPSITLSYVLDPLEVSYTVGGTFEPKQLVVPELVTLVLKKK